MTSLICIIEEFSFSSHYARAHVTKIEVFRYM